MAALTAAEPGLRARIGAASMAARLHFTVTPADAQQAQQDVVTHGLPADMVRGLEQAGVDSAAMAQERQSVLDTATYAAAGTVRPFALGAACAGAPTATPPPKTTATFTLVPSLTKVSNTHPQELTIDAAAGMGVVQHCCDGGGWNINFTFKVRQTLTPGTNAQVTAGIQIFNVKPDQPLAMQMSVLAPDFAQALSINYPHPSSGSKTFQIPVSASYSSAKELTIQVGFYSSTVTYTYRP